MSLRGKDAPEKISIYLFSAQPQNVFALSSFFSQPACKLAKEATLCAWKLNFTVTQEVLLPSFQETVETVHNEMCDDDIKPDDH